MVRAEIQTSREFRIGKLYLNWNLMLIKPETYKRPIKLLEKLSELEKIIIEKFKTEQTEIEAFNFNFFDKFFQEFAPEIASIRLYNEDITEELQMKTGVLQENRILGIFLKNNLEGKKKITTQDVKSDYKTYFKALARSTISLYLNLLNKESILFKERNGRLVYYKFFEEPPRNISSFWFTRIFCILPSYFNRAMYFYNLFINAKVYVQGYLNKYGKRDRIILIENFKFLIGLILLKLFKNRIHKCVYCQFSNKKTCVIIENVIDIANKDRSDVLSKEIFNGLIQDCSEIPTFDGIDISSKIIKENLVEELLRITVLNIDDLEFQRRVSLKRQSLRAKNKEIM
ncbi:MAG: hypothetical protein ACFFDF_00885 [Candidatus Odinarchaeota archaeon]